MPEVYNFAQYLIDGCRLHPGKTALSIPTMDGHQLQSEESATFEALLKRVACFQEGLARQGITDGDRLIIIVKPTIDLYALIIACFCSGVIPVFVDTGMGKKKIIMALEDSKAKAIVSSRQLLKYFWLIKPLRKMQRYSVDGTLPLCASIDLLKPPVIGCPLSVLPRNPQDHCLITFTSGSTGRPKGADRTHQCLINQHLALKNSVQYKDGDYGLSCFPVAALHQFACGVPTALPRVDLAAIGDVNAPLVIDQIKHFNITYIGSASAFLEKVVAYLESESCQLEQIRLVIIGGSTVASRLLSRAKQVLPNATLMVVYGSTESEPISHINSEEILAAPEANGYLVGRPVPECEVKVIDSVGQTLTGEAELLARECTTGQPGEIVVSGGHVLQSYIDNPAATRETKIPGKSGSVWHRTGDYGFMDEQARIWLTGRDKDLISYQGALLPNYCMEIKLDALNGVSRAAVLNIDNKMAVVVETTKDQVVALKADIEACCQPVAGADLILYAIEKMPVDGRHNSKIDRPLLKKLISEKQLLAIDESDNTNQSENERQQAQPISLKSEWQTPERRLILKSVLAACLLILVAGSSSVSNALFNMVLSLYVQVPVVIGGVLHMVVVTKDSWPGLKIPLWERQFGKNKTWRGMIAVPALTLLGVIPLALSEGVQRFIFGDSLLAGYSLIALGLVGGLGYVLGELPNSYLKRRMGAAPGEMPSNNRNFFIALDQIDSAVGVALLYGWLIGLPLTVCLLYLVTFPVTALVVKFYLHKYKLKDMAR